MRLPGSQAVHTWRLSTPVPVPVPVLVLVLVLVLVQVRELGPARERVQQQGNAGAAWIRVSPDRPRRRQARYPLRRVRAAALF